MNPNILPRGNECNAVWPKLPLSKVGNVLKIFFAFLVYYILDSHLLLYIIDILSKGEELYETSGAKKVKQKVDHLSEDAREAWETSQSPWVYRMSSVYDTLTKEHEYTVAVRELRKLDPDFTLEEWKEDVVEHELPIIMKWFLEGKINQLKPWLGEAVFNRIAAEITARKQEGVQIDTHVLAIMNSEILACEVSFLCQQSGDYE